MLTGARRLGPSLRGKMMLKVPLDAYIGLPYCQMSGIKALELLWFVDCGTTWFGPSVRARVGVNPSDQASAAVLGREGGESSDVDD